MSHTPDFDLSQIVHPEDEFPAVQTEDGRPALSEAQRRFLDHRLEELDRNPGDGRDWAEIRAELREKAARRRASAA